MAGRRAECGGNGAPIGSTTVNARRDGPAQPVMAAVWQLLQPRDPGAGSLGAVASALESLGQELGADLVAVGVDDDALGRQVFSSRRRPLGSLDGLCVGPPRVAADPEIDFSPTERDLLVRAVGIAVSGCGEPSWASWRSMLELALGRTRRGGPTVTVVAVEAPDLDAENLPAAIGRARGLVRASEPITPVGSRRLAWLLEGTGVDGAPAALARLAGGARLGRLVFGVAVCPMDGISGDVLLATAETRLDDAIALRARGAARH